MNVLLVLTLALANDVGQVVSLVRGLWNAQPHLGACVLCARKLPYEYGWEAGVLLTIRVWRVRFDPRHCTTRGTALPHQPGPLGRVVTGRVNGHLLTPCSSSNNPHS